MIQASEEARDVGSGIITRGLGESELHKGKHLCCSKAYVINYANCINHKVDNREFLVTVFFSVTPIHLV